MSLAVFYATQDNEVTGRGKVAFRHDCYYQFTISQCVCDALWFYSGTAGNRKPPFPSGGGISAW